MGMGGGHNLLLGDCVMCVERVKMQSFCERGGLCVKVY